MVWAIALQIQTKAPYLELARQPELAGGFRFSCMGFMSGAISSSLCKLNIWPKVYPCSTILSSLLFSHVHCLPCMGWLALLEQ